MECLPSVEWNDVARTHDIALLHTDLNKVETALRADMVALEATLRGELQTGLAGLRVEIHQGFNRQLVWLMMTILGSVGAVLGLIGYVS